MHWVTDPEHLASRNGAHHHAASQELRAIPGVRNFGAHIGQAFAADEVVGVNFGENWISISQDVDYDRPSPPSKRSSKAIPASTVTCRPT